jgi:hypothetical protein
MLPLLATMIFGTLLVNLGGLLFVLLNRCKRCRKLRGNCFCTGGPI